jgi:pyruvate formate lyase activating enzyme
LPLVAYGSNSLTVVQVKAYIAGKPLLSTTDWPSKASCVVFFAGCNLRCRFCFNGPILALEERFAVDLESLYTELAKQRFLIEGVIATGGEPTLQPLSLHALAVWARQSGLLFGLMTNGTKPKVLRDLLADRLLDYIAIDIKTVPSVEAYAQITQSEEDLLPPIKESIKLARQSKISYEFRTTLVPGLIDEPDQIRKISQWVGTKNYVLQAFLPGAGVLDSGLRQHSFTPETLSRLRGLGKRLGIAVRF